MMHGGPGTGFGGHMFPGYGWLFQLLILVLLLLIFWWLLRGQAGQLRRNETPLEVAQRRYAAGEISRKEFEQLKKDLK